MTKNLITFIAVLILTGCSSFGKGVTEAILEKKDQEDNRLCEIWGKGFNGIKANLRDKQIMKVLMVHGVGDHQPGYATEFSEKLANSLDLTVTSSKHKNIKLRSLDSEPVALGHLRIRRYLNKAQDQELLFYELTWSEITSAQKQILAYDNSGEYSFKRAEFNDLMKRFSNDTGPDPIIYLGESRNDILKSFAQSFCWMTYGNWNNLPSEGEHSCDQLDLSSIKKDQYAFVSHSLGSRITIDGLQSIVAKFSESVHLRNLSNTPYDIDDALKNKIITIYMLSNQLPMLQLGRNLPEVTGKKDSYCMLPGKDYAQRMFDKTHIIAFSDPNDLLSYAIPQGFSEQYLDSRLCVDVNNVNINIAHVYDIFGLGGLANPMEAHIGYDTDDRVIELIAKGVGTEYSSPLVKERCRWMQTIE
jgi:hypothetical protein